MMESVELMTVQSQLEAMGLTVMAAQLSSVAERAAAQKDTYVTFLRTLLEPEVDSRQERWATTRTQHTWNPGGREAMILPGTSAGRRVYDEGRAARARGCVA